MTGLIRKYLLRIIENIDTGNSDIDEDEEAELVETLRKLTDRSRRMSKYEACQYLGVSRATFDNYVRCGKLPEGRRQAGFKELSWSRKEIDNCISRHTGQR